jgi:hypothetical protein
MQMHREVRILPREKRDPREVSSALRHPKSTTHETGPAVTRKDGHQLGADARLDRLQPMIDNEAKARNAPM